MDASSLLAEDILADTLGRESSRSSRRPRKWRARQERAAQRVAEPFASILLALDLGALSTHERLVSIAMKLNDEPCAAIIASLDRMLTTADPGGEPRNEEAQRQHGEQDRRDVHRDGEGDGDGNELKTLDGSSSTTWMPPMSTARPILGNAISRTPAAHSSNNFVHDLMNAGNNRSH